MTTPKPSTAPPPPQSRSQRSSNPGPTSATNHPATGNNRHSGISDFGRATQFPSLDRLQRIGAGRGRHDSGRPPLHIPRRGQGHGALRTSAHRPGRHNRQPSADRAAHPPRRERRIPGIGPVRDHLPLRPFLLEHPAAHHFPGTRSADRLRAGNLQPQDAASRSGGAGGHIRRLLGSARHRRVRDFGSGVHWHNRRRGRPHHHLPVRSTRPGDTRNHGGHSLLVHGGGRLHTAAPDETAHHQARARNRDAATQTGIAPGKAAIPHHRHGGHHPHRAEGRAAHSHVHDWQPVPRERSRSRA